ncbi:MAG: polyprenyl synthetase family protein [Chlamydiales bacterium]
MASTIHSFVGSYHEQIEGAISKAICLFGPKTELRDAIEYALKNGGKRFRPAIVYMVAKALGKDLDVTEAALAIEFFHTASLIADDLPSMDNDERRRNSPTVHIAYDEATALLASYALISAGYDQIRLNAHALKQKDIEKADTICVLALENATYHTGILGAVGGQYLDLFSQELNEETVQEIMYKKTGSLFEISFVFGWLFGGGVLTELEKVKKVAKHFGMAFQISDDFLDLKEDIEHSKVNYPAVVGRKRALQAFSQEVAELKKLLQELELNTSELLSLVEHMIGRISSPPSL